MVPVNDCPRVGFGEHGNTTGSLTNVMSTFEDRRKCLFDQLSAAEKQHNFGRSEVEFPAGTGEVDRRAYRRLKGEMKQFRGKESIFKRPEAPLSRCLRARNLPQHIKEPRKWLHYSLEDVSADDMSDATNTATAFALLRELERRNEDKTPMICDASPDSSTPVLKPTFCLSATIKTEKSDPDPPKVTFRNNKMVMPEYVVGKTERRTKKKTIKREEDSKRAELKLEHLYEEEE